MARRHRRNRKQQKELKRKRKAKGEKQKLAKQGALFLEGEDSYVTEFRRLTRAGIVPSLIGVYELDHARFDAPDTDEKLARVGLHGHSLVFYESEFDNERRTDPSIVTGAGATSVVMDAASRIRPVVFIRKRDTIDSTERSADARTNKESTDAVRVLVLLHELGHADDIAQGINYDHVEKTVDLIGAEVHAHRFTCEHAKRRDHRLLLGYYLDDIDEKLRSQTEYVRLTAERFHREADVPALRKFAARPQDYRAILRGRGVLPGEG